MKRICGEFAIKRAGWKIHLTVNPIFHMLVDEWLDKNCVYGWKYGRSSDQPGKDFTIYVGGYDEVQRFAELLKKEIGRFLDVPKGDTMKDNLLINNKITARFDTRDRRFHQYGMHGLPFLIEDMNFTLWNKLEYTKKRAEYLKKFVERSYTVLNKEYGVYFRGSRNQVTKIILHFLN